MANEPRPEDMERLRAGTLPCDVCRLVHGDPSPKPDVKYCHLCDSWICDTCRPRWDWRTVAAMKKAFAFTKVGTMHREDK